MLSRSVARLLVLYATAVWSSPESPRRILRAWRAKGAGFDRVNVSKLAHDIVNVYYVARQSYSLTRAL